MISAAVYERLAGLLPEKLRAQALMAADWEKIEEIRLRTGQAMMLVYAAGQKKAGTRTVTRQDLDYILARAANNSVYAELESIKNGYLTVDGGHRLGLAGSVVIKDGEVTNINNLTSIAIRIAGEVKGASKDVIRAYGGEFDSTLIVAPPGCGKTTLLRDMICNLSNSGFRISVCDERGELAACHAGVPQLPIGENTDVLSGCPKAEGMLMLLRSMNPQIIAVDEITAAQDVAAIEQAANCGVQLLATAHGRSMEDLLTRELYRRLIDLGVFKYIVIIKNDGSHRARLERLVRAC